MQGPIEGKAEEMKGQARQPADKTRRAVPDIRGDVRAEAGQHREPASR